MIEKWWWILFVYYVVLILIYWYIGSPRFETPSTPTKPSGTSTDILKVRTTLHQFCKSDENCVTDQICFHNSCLPKLRKGGHCNPLTGGWVVVQEKGENFVTCTCKYPHLMTQQYPGSDCNLPLACNPLGKLLILENAIQCECPYGYKSVDRVKEGETTTPTCVRMDPDEMDEIGPCQSDQLDSRSSYLISRNHTVAKCIKRPCTFDALTSKRLKHARFDSKWGCVCNPKYGNIGVHIDHPDYLLTPGHYNACVNIFKEEPLHELSNVILYSYFYVFDKRPISFIQYTDIDPQTLAPPFRNLNNSFRNLQIEETWPYNYMQYVFTHKKFVALTKACIEMEHIDPENLYHSIVSYCHKKYSKLGHITACKNIPKGF